MRTTVIDAANTLWLGKQAEAAGFRAGAVVDVVLLSTGSVLVRLSDAQPLDLPALPARGLPAPRAAVRRAG